MQPQACIQASTFTPAVAAPAGVQQAQGWGERRRCESASSSVSSRSEVKGICRGPFRQAAPSWTSSSQGRSGRLQVSAESILQQSAKRPQYIPNRIDDPNYVRIFDTTLRDGEQLPGATLSSKEKLAIAHKLAKLGVDIIEAGFPHASADDLEAVRNIAREVGNNVDDNGYVPVICVVARCNKADIDAAWEGVRCALRPRIHISIPTSPMNMQTKLRKTPDEVVETARSMVAYARSLGCEDIEFSPEDSGRSEPEFLYRILEEVITAGATTLNIPDTVGYTMPNEFGELIAKIKANTAGIDKVVLSTHCQNELGLATANTLAGAKAGARQVEVTINGIAERGGNASLEEVVLALRYRGKEHFGGLYTGIDPKHISIPGQMLRAGLEGSANGDDEEPFFPESGNQDDYDSETDSIASSMSSELLMTDVINSPKVDDNILAQAYASSLTTANPVEGPVENKAEGEDGDALTPWRTGGFRPHISGLHSLWRGLRTQMRVAATSPPNPDEQDLSSIEPALPPAAEPENENGNETPRALIREPDTGSRKTSTWAMSALLNWRRELQQERLRAVREEGSVAMSNGAAACSGSQKLIDCPSCVGFAPGEVVVGSSSTVSAPQDARGVTTHTRETFSRFLLHSSLVELKTISLMAMLCDMAYNISGIKESCLFRDHRLRLITSSKAIAAKAAAAAANAPKPPPAGANIAKTSAEENGTPSGGGSILFPSSAYAFATAAANYIAAQSRSILPSSTPKSGAKAEPQGTAAAALEVAAKVAATSSEKAVETLEFPVLPASVPQTTAVAVDVVAAAAVATSGSGNGSSFALESKQQRVTEVVRQGQPLCPCEWFVCDDNGTHTRYFVIQGSDSLASWQANISFDPVVFEEKSLGVLVHRGIYEAAQALYTQLLPFVRQHIRAHGETHARFRFTGHSLGGSLAALISLMLHIRNEVPRSTLEPVGAFGSPSIMCGGDFLLERLGLSQDHILSISMHRDIVPRAFACDYPDHVAEVLRRVSGSFRDHPCLLRQRLMYAPMGVMMVLQPDEKQAPPHPLLPEGVGLYRIRHPENSDDVTPIVNGDDNCSLGGLCSTEGEETPRPHRFTRAAELRAAQRAILNHPHPLEILSDPGAYGTEGAISRDHDPRNYKKIVNHVLRQEGRRWRKVQREQRRQQWWPLVGAEAAAAASQSQETSSGRLSGPGLTDSSRRGPAGSHMGGLTRSPSLRQVQTVAGRAVPGEGASGGSYGKGTSTMRGKDRSRRYSRLVASQHVHLGTLAIALTYPLGIVADLGSYFTGM